jgi:hypothetical protein
MLTLTSSEDECNGIDKKKMSEHKKYKVRERDLRQRRPTWCERPTTWRKASGSATATASSKHSGNIRPLLENAQWGTL